MGNLQSHGSAGFRCQASQVAGCAVPMHMLMHISCRSTFPWLARCTQGPSGCVAPELAWRREPDGYLKQVQYCGMSAPLQRNWMNSPAPHVNSCQTCMKSSDVTPCRSGGVLACLAASRGGFE